MSVFPAGSRDALMPHWPPPEYPAAPAGMGTAASRVPVGARAVGFTDVPSRSERRYPAPRTMICAVCGEEKTIPKWYKIDEGSPLRQCQLCYQKARGNAAPRTMICAVCGKEKTIPKWYKIDEGSPLRQCQLCYQKVRRNAAQERSCDGCGTIKKSRFWYPIENHEGALQCTDCLLGHLRDGVSAPPPPPPGMETAADGSSFDPSALYTPPPPPPPGIEMAADAGAQAADFIDVSSPSKPRYPPPRTMICAVCGKRKTIREWHKISDGSPLHQCQLCYREARKYAAQERSCDGCGTIKKSRFWYPIENHEGALQCTDCLLEHLRGEVSAPPRKKHEGESAQAARTARADGVSHEQLVDADPFEDLYL